MMLFGRWTLDRCVARPLLLLLCAAWIGNAAAADERELGADLAGLLDYAREHNPELAASRYEADAAVQRLQPAGALPDPVLRTELMDVTNQGSGKGMSLLPSQVGSTRYLLMQQVPWFGKRRLQREVAEGMVAQADGQVVATWTELSGQIKAAFAQYYYLSGSERLTREMLALLAAMEQVAQTRYANGAGVQQDVIRAQVEQSELRVALLELEMERHHAHVRLNALLSRPALAPLAQPLLMRPLPPPTKLDYALLEARLRSANPQLQIADAQIFTSGKNRDLVYRDRYPGFTFGIAPNQSGRALKSWDVMVEFNIPLQQESRRAREREAEAQLAASNARKQALFDRMLADLSESAVALETARRSEILTTTQLLPQSELTYQSALNGYENGKVDFATLLDAQRQVLKTKRELLKTQLEEQLRLTDIEKLVGEEL